MNRNKKNLILGLVLVLLLLVVGVTYAFFTYESGTKSDIVTGQIYMNYEETSTISLIGVFPETKEQALARTDENGVFEFTITGRNTSKYPVYYEIDLLEGGVMTGKTESSTKILPEHVMIYLEKDGVPVIEGKTYADWNNKPIYVETVPAGTISNIEHKYTLRMWIDENVTISDTDPNADYTTSEWNDAYTSLKVRVVGDFEEKEVNPTLMKKIEKTLTLTDASTDIDGTRYVTGDNDIPNYVWYSGKLWRIVSINSDGTIKLVTQGNMTSIAWSIESETVDGTTTYNTVYEDSQIHNWLKNEFLPTLANANTLLADSTWDYTTYAEATATKAEPVNYVEGEKVGLLTIYDLYKVGTGSSSFLNNGYYWWTMSPQTDASRVWCVYNTGDADYSSPAFGLGVRPSVNLKSDIQIMGGSGTKSNPYVIGGDKDTGVASELLSNRISGEYINFNDVLYRIVGTEEINGQKLTKITMADYSLNNNTLTSLAFGESSSQRIFSPTYGIGLYLEEWYQADSTSETYSTIYIKDNYKAMIATSGEDGDGVEWYTGPTSPTEPLRYDYTLAKTGTPVSATIGLGYYGEMFSSQFGDGYGSSTTTWLMTIYSSSRVWSVHYYGDARYNSLTNSRGVRASMYLKSDVKIVSGNGQFSSPYEIS